MNHMKFESPDLTAQNIDRIAALFPNCITEMLDEEHSTPEKKVYKRAVNFELLKQMLSPDVVDGDEAYEFTWVGKKAAIVEANKPIRKTLRPCMAESKDWDTTENLYIEGDNLEVLKLLQESYLGKVKMIYIDPPYNTGNDFIYADDFMRSQEEENAQMGMYDEDENRLFKNTDTNGRFHSDWCSMIYSRLMLARNLLTVDGVIFISIDDNEVDDLMKIANDAFGKDNFLACFPRVTKKAGKTTDAIAKNHDYILAYSKSALPTLFLPSHTDEGFRFSDEYEAQRGKYKLNQTLDYDSLQYSASLDYPITVEGETFYPGQSYEKYLDRKNGNHARADWAWRWSKDLFDFGYKNGFIVIKKYDGYSRIYTKTYQNCKIAKTASGFTIEYIQRTKAISTLEFVENEYSNDNSKKNLTSLFESSVFDYSKPTALLKTLAQYSSTADDIVMDFFSGSATTAHAVMQLNAEDGGHRKFIMVQLPEKCDETSEAYKAGYKNICEIGKERIRRAGDKIKSESPMTTQDLDIGFRVLKLDDTNMKDVYYAPDDYDQGMLAGLESNIKDDRTDLDLLFGCLIDWGLPLSLPYKSEQIDGCTVHTYNDGDLIACFDTNIPESVVKEIAQRKPLRAVFRDSGFASSPEKINVFEIFKLYMPEDANDITKRVRVI
ncbi:MAG TPA: site-specific DNA-methyltransferase [Clostridiales bacterium]|nr:site-specific DNA-methyltransferase [Clostridiales bacterium]